MKKFILGFVAGLIFAGLISYQYPIISSFIRGFFSKGPKLVTPENLNPEVRDYGSLRVEIFGKGNPLKDVEVGVGIIGPKGPEVFTPMKTDTQGVALFEKIPVGIYDVSFNGFRFPKDYEMPVERNYVTIVKNQLTQKRIDLTPKQ